MIRADLAYKVMIFTFLAEDNVFSPKSANSVAGGMSNSPRKFYSAEKSHRLSERFTTSTAPSSDSARYYRKRRSQPGNYYLLRKWYVC